MSMVWWWTFDCVICRLLSAVMYLVFGGVGVQIVWAGHIIGLQGKHIAIADVFWEVPGAKACWLQASKCAKIIAPTQVTLSHCFILTMSLFLDVKHLVSSRWLFLWFMFLRLMVNEYDNRVDIWNPPKLSLALPLIPSALPHSKRQSRCWPMRTLLEASAGHL